jgi:hypothetical protein
MRRQGPTSGQPMSLGVYLRRLALILPFSLGQPEAVPLQAGMHPGMALGSSGSKAATRVLKPARATLWSRRRARRSGSDAAT